jgi:hypothetical protein
MPLKLSTWLLVALTGGALLAGCGSGNSTTSSQTAAPAPGAITPAIARRAVARCIHTVRAQTSIPASAKAQLEKTCEKAASGNATALQNTARELCVQFVNASHVPAGIARERALAVCRAK